MKYFVVEIVTQTATFRNPDFQNFHKTLFLPPPTTIIGLAGAALGLSPKKAQEFFEKNKIKIGIFGKSKGIAKDLWKYRNLDGSRSVIKKEILFKNVFNMGFVANDEIAEEMRQAFLNPVFVLTMGNNDSLAFVKNVTELFEATEMEKRFEVEYCMAKGDIIDEVMSNIGNGLEISIYNTSDPIAYDLPVKFEYESEYGMRSVIERKPFSFVGKKMKLNVEKEGVLYSGNFIPIFEI